jgi:hypothetical protein
MTIITPLSGYLGYREDDPSSGPLSFDAFSPYVILSSKPSLQRKVHHEILASPHDLDILHPV